MRGRMIEELYSSDFFLTKSKQEQIDQLRVDLEYWYEEANTLRRLYENCRKRNIALVKLVNEKRIAYMDIQNNKE